MPLSQKAPIKYQSNQDVTLSQKTTYTLPPRKKINDISRPAPILVSQTLNIRQDLLKTFLIAFVILGLEIVVWLRVR